MGGKKGTMTVLDLAMRWAEMPRVLIVEKKEDAAAALRNTLAELGCAADVVATQDEALKAVFANKYALVLVGLSLPAGQQSSLCRAVESVRPDTRVMQAIATA